MVVYTQALLDFSQDKHGQARESLQKTLRVARSTRPASCSRGAVEFKLDSMEQAERHLRKDLETNPGHAYARKLLVFIYLKRGRTSEAQTTLAPALTATPDDPHLLALAGAAAMQQRDFDKAAGYFQQASTLAPKASSLRTALAMSKLGKGDTDSAIVDLEASTKLDNTSSRAGVLLVMAEMCQKRYDKSHLPARAETGAVHHAVAIVAAQAALALAVACTRASTHCQRTQRVSVHPRSNGALATGPTARFSSPSTRRSASIRGWFCASS